MRKKYFKKCKSSNKGITLIALIITIIVLLILAGVTIAQLTGSDSAPNKANEAKQKNDIGTARDDVSLTATNALTEAYETAYVANGVEAKNASTTVGSLVRTKLNQKYGTDGNFKTGLATITATSDGEITIWTTDFEITGEIAEKGGQLTWGEMIPNTPGVFLNKTEATLNPGGSLVITARKKNVSENITWTITGDSTITKTEDNEDNLKVTINVALGANDGESAVLKASAGGYESTCTITVEKLPVASVAFVNPPSEIEKNAEIELTINIEDSNHNPTTANSITYEAKLKSNGSDTDLVTIGAKTGEANKAILTAGNTTGGPVTIKVIADGKENSFDVNIVTPTPVPTSWVKTTSADSAWYSYGGKTVNTPKISGTKMTPIKYQPDLVTGMNTTNKWANAITADGSMFVWIPRYAYKITYYTSNTYETPSTNNAKTQYGVVDVIFVGTNNQDLAGTVTNITADPTESGAGTSKYLVHPAFVDNVNAGGWDSELTGIWVGKFETTGSYNSSKGTGTLSVMPATASLRSMTINQMYKFALAGKFGETSTTTLNSHMAKNSEWGAVAYLAYSDYGKGQDVTQNTSSSYYTGGSSTAASIYSSNYGQSTTNNPYGVYDLSGCGYEYVASYANYGSNSSNLSTYGGTTSGDLYGSSTEQNVSTRYKTVYAVSGTSQQNSYNLLDPSNTSNTDKTKVKKGDAIWETSTSYTGSTSWNRGGNSSVISEFPDTSRSFFSRDGGRDFRNAGMFYFYGGNGNVSDKIGFRVVLCP